MVFLTKERAGALKTSSPCWLMELYWLSRVEWLSRNWISL
jgi:hypothetical protein